MKLGICLVTQIPVRSKPSEKSEMITQVLFGETFKVEEINGSWVNVNLYDDHYRGWVDTKMITPLSKNDFDQLRDVPVRFTRFIHHTFLESIGPVILPPGSTIYSTEGGKSHFFKDYGLNMSYVPSIKVQSRKNLISSAENWLNAPYLWGGKTPFGFDCSGFTQVIYKTMGINISRDAVHQSSEGDLVNFLSTALPGDLAFFENEEEEISHVGIIHSNGKVIHCFGKVKIDDIDQQGIYNKAQEKYTHKLRLIKRILPDELQ